MSLSFCFVFDALRRTVVGAGRGKMRARGYHSGGLKLTKGYFGISEVGFVLGTYLKTPLR